MIPAKAEPERFRADGRLRLRLSYLAGVCVLVGLIASDLVSSAAEVVLPRYQVTDLGELINAHGLNNRGVVAGYAQPPRSTDFRPYVYRGGQKQLLPTLPGYENSGAEGINDLGHVVGNADHFALDKHGSLDCPSRAFLWRDGKLRDLGTLGGRDSESAHVNNNDQVVGRSRTGRRFTVKLGSMTLKTPIDHAFLWQEGRMRDLGTLGGPDSSAAGVNDRGQVVGSAQTRREEHAFLWENGRMRDLGTLGTKSEAMGINNKGEVVGVSGGRAVLWQEDKMKYLGSLGDNLEYGGAAAINDGGQIVGTAASSTMETDPRSVKRAFLYREGRMLDLNDLIPKGTQWVLEGAWAINNRGQIIAYGKSRSQEGAQSHTLLLTPAREVSVAGGPASGFELWDGAQISTLKMSEGSNGG